VTKGPNDKLGGAVMEAARSALERVDRELRRADDAAWWHPEVLKWERGLVQRVPLLREFFTPGPTSQSDRHSVTVRPLMSVIDAPGESGWPGRSMECRASDLECADTRGPLPLGPEPVRKPHPLCKRELGIGGGT